MTVSPLDAEKNVLDTISDLHDQLNATIKSNQIVEDYALLNGFLTFVGSKLSRMVTECLQTQNAIYEDISNGNSRESRDLEINSESIPLILRLYWEKICYPIFKWFQAWRAMLLPRELKEQKKYVEFRKMNSKLKKFFKSVHMFYYKIIEELLNKYDTSAVIADDIIKELNCAGKKCGKKTQLDSKSNFTVSIVISLHCCLLNLGSAHRYKSLVEKFSTHYSIQDFKKSMRYFNLACSILPSIGEAHLQKGLVYVQTENLGTAIYEFTRSSLARIPNSAAQANFETIISDNDSRLHKKLDLLLKDISVQDLSRVRIVNREIIEYYFLALFGSHFAPSSWLNSSKPSELQNGIRIDYLKRTLDEKMSTRYIKNIDTIFEDLIIVIGGFDLLLLRSRRNKDSSDIRMLSLKALSPEDLEYLEFALSFATHILKIVKESWEKNIEKYQYLAMVRVVECWLKCNRAVLQYSHRNEKFCGALAELINDILRSQKLELDPLTSHRPKRSYYMKEDIDLKEFSTIKYALSDFNDDHIFTMSDSTDRLAGFPPLKERLDSSAEGQLRLQAIFVAGKKFLAKNGCGIQWSSSDLRYVIPAKVAQSKRPKPGSWAAILSKEQPANTKLVGNILQKDNRLAKQEHSRQTTTQFDVVSQTVYSGSSAPMAPPTFTIKPSSNLTGRKLNCAIDDAVGKDTLSEDPIANLDSESQPVEITNSDAKPDLPESPEDKAVENKKLKVLNDIFLSDHVISPPALASQTTPILPSVSDSTMPYAVFNSAVRSAQHGMPPYSTPLAHPGYGMHPIAPSGQLHDYGTSSVLNGWMGQYPQQMTFPPGQQQQQFFHNVHSIDKYNTPTNQPSGSADGFR